MFSNPMFLELVVKERRQALEKEARMIQALKSVKKKNRKKQGQGIEKIANLLISFGEKLKKRYCPEISDTDASSLCLSKEVSRC